ncbi:hypothetical protein XACN24_09055 [Xanthomonas albilineans]|uniref:Uncharacterized protein n=2 Tax=Xanthomonas albilineans TaxID=29447 RepID=D2UE09_XANAP|nr:hypothetical protein [Xanthomonas albilineans]CBA16358.1 hypothetical protein XALC_1868 [Xanthomonas albilineans GPE PC73]
MLTLPAISRHGLGVLRPPFNTRRDVARSAARDSEVQTWRGYRLTVLCRLDMALADNPPQSRARGHPIGGQEENDRKHLLPNVTRKELNVAQQTLEESQACAGVAHMGSGTCDARSAVNPKTEKPPIEGRFSIFLPYYDFEDQSNHRKFLI